MTTSSESRIEAQGPIVDALGYTYASPADRLLGRIEKTMRNGNIAVYWRIGYTEEAIRAYWQAFDTVATPCPPPSSLFADCHHAGIAAAKLVGGFHLPPRRTTERARQPSPRGSTG